LTGNQQAEGEYVMNVRTFKFADAILLHRDFILASIIREFNAKYRSSLLGGIWAILNPLTLIFIYTFVFSQLMRASLPGSEGDTFAFSVFLCAGILPWIFFTDVFSRLSTVFTDNSSLIKKTPIPKSCFPVIVIGGCLINFLISLGIFFVFLILIGKWPGIAVLNMFPIVVLQTIFAAGLGVFFGVLHVFFRDVSQFIGVILQIWFWLTPIIYPLSVLPVYAQGVVAANPMAPVVNAYQGIFLLGRAPDWGALTAFLILALLSLVLAHWFFMRQQRELVDEL
jgi:lipopolysaccharide transport system permease protein